jgi:TonB family protein
MRRMGVFLIALALSLGLLIRTSTAQTQEHAGRKVLSKIAPIYPELARRMHVSGTVKLEIAIRADGNVKSTKALGGNPVLILAATDAVRKWKFEAAPEETTEIVQLAFEPQ